MESNQHVRKQSILAWRAAVHGVTGSRARLNDFTFTFHFHVLEKEMATHSSILAWRIPGTEEPSGLLSVGLHRVRHNWSNLAEAAAVAAGQVRKKNTVSVKQSCLTLCNPMDYNSPDSSLHGILQVWILECTAIPFSRASPHPGSTQGLPNCKQILYGLSQQRSPGQFRGDLKHKAWKTAVSATVIFAVVSWWKRQNNTE